MTRSSTNVSCGTSPHGCIDVDEKDPKADNLPLVSPLNASCGTLTAGVNVYGKY